jgi:hypothetical protein
VVIAIRSQLTAALTDRHTSEAEAELEQLRRSLAERSDELATMSSIACQKATSATAQRSAACKLRYGPRRCGCVCIAERSKLRPAALARRACAP